MSHELNATGRRHKSALFGVLLTWCTALVAFRVLRTGSGYYLFLIWNLFLACVPLMLSRLLRKAHDRRASDIAQLVLAALWLLFLPNAPYLFTDFVHLHPSTPLLYSYDLTLLLSCAATGLLLGYSSLFDVHTIVSERFGHRCGWAAVIIALSCSGYGIYLGRVQRWNSWDVFANPSGLFGSIADLLLNPAQHLHVYALSGLASVALLLGYAALHSTIGLVSTPVKEQLANRTGKHLHR
jgi:uncharacterized membrane protein